MSQPVRVPYRLVAMLGIGLLINYADRGSIGIALPLLQKEFGLSSIEIGWLGSAFFWAYIPLQPLMGWLADRIGAARVLAGGFALWSIATALAGNSHGIASLMVLRVLMGVGESVFYPCAMNLLAKRVSVQHRTRATGTVTLGGLIGPAAGTFIGGLIMVHYGWRVMFVGLGLGSLLWLAPWLRFMRRDRAAAVAESGSRGPAFAAILGQRALWGAMLAIFCSNYAFYFVFTWLPLYLVEERQLSLSSMTALTGSIYLVDGASVLLTGWLLDAWIRRGASINRAYKMTLIVSGAGVGLCLLACTSVGMTGAVIALLMLGFMDGLNSPTTCAVTQTFAGPDASGRWMGMQNAGANLAGVTAPVVTGYLVHATGHYTAALIVAGSVALLGVFAWLFAVPTVRPVDWAGHGTALRAR